MENEIWKDVPGYEGHYMVSNMGRVKSLKHNREHILKPQNNGDGYLQVRLYLKGYTSPYVHNLVWTTFVGPIPEGLEINHHDEEKKNNSLANLELMTREENNNFGTRTERTRKPVLQFDLQGNFIREYNSLTEAAKGIGKKSPGNIGCCLTGRKKTAGGFVWKYK